MPGDNRERRFTEEELLELCIRLAGERGDYSGPTPSGTCIEHCLLGTATADEYAELEQALRSSPTFRAEILELLRGAESVAGASGVDSVPAVPAIQVPALAEFLRRVENAKPSAVRRARWVYVAMAALLLAVSIPLVVTTIRHRDPGQPSEHAAWHLEVTRIDPALLIVERYRAPSQAKPLVDHLNAREAALAAFQGILQLDSSGLSMAIDLTAFESAANGDPALAVVDTSGNPIGILTLPTSHAKPVGQLQAWGLSIPSLALYKADVVSIPATVNWAVESDSVLCLALVLSDGGTARVLAQRALIR